MDIPKCIFCEKPRTKVRENGKKFYVFCPDCRARGPEKKSREDAIIRYKAGIKEEAHGAVANALG